MTRRDRRPWSLLLVVPLCLASPAGAEDPPGASPAPAGSSSATAPAAAPAEPVDLREAERQWARVLELARRHGPSEERLEVERALESPLAPWVKGLADVALDEWRLKPGDSRLESPRRAWAPVLPPVAEIAPDARKLGRTVSGQAEISVEGRVSSARIDERSGDERVDFAVEKWVREGRWRPAVKERKYVRSSTRWSVELR